MAALSLLYCDEIVPGNVLGRAERKCWCIYATILQFGDHMSQEEAWLSLSVERSTFVTTLDGGIAQIFAIILSSIFNNPIVDPKTTGIKLKNLTMGDLTIWFDFAMVLADGAAQKQVWSSKGDSGTRFCLQCSNVHATRIDTTATDEQDHIFCETMMYSQLQLVHDQELLDSYQRLHARFSTCTKKVFLQWQQATGLTYSKYALMLNESLLSKGLIQPISQFCHDWMHGVLQGTAPVVLHHMLATLSEHFQSIHDLLSKYFEVWTLPKGWKSQHLPKLFLKKNQNAQGKATKFSCLASEILGIFPILRHFLCTIVEPKALCPLAIQAFYAMAHVIDQCHGGVQWKRTTRESLLLAVEAANQTFRAAWPDAPMIRKWHWHLHLPDTMARFGMLPSCFTAERKHKTISAFATKLTKTSHFEKHLLQQIVPNEISTLQELHLFPEVGHLIKPQKAQAKHVEALLPFLSTPPDHAEIASSCQLSRGGYIHGGDAICFSNEDGISTWRIAKVILHAKVFGLTATLVQLWTIEAMHQWHANCKATPSTCLIPMENILFPVPFTTDGEMSTVLLPSQIYSLHTSQKWKWFAACTEPHVAFHLDSKALFWLYMASKASWLYILIRINIIFTHFCCLLFSFFSKFDFINAYGTMFFNI